MFQTFDATTNPADGPSRLAALRAALSGLGLTGFLVPRADRHQGEYVAPCDERLAWLTGFTGSAGFAAVLPDVAGVFIDGRYRVQVKAQVDTTHFTPVDWPETRLADWLIAQAPAGAKIGFDPWLHTVKEVAALSRALEAKGLALVPVAQNPVDGIWQGRPAEPAAPIVAHALEFAGESSADKRARLGAELREAGVGAAVLTLPDSVCWLLNIRGADIARNPVARVNAVLEASGKVDLFCDPAQVEGLDLGADVAVLPRASFAAALAELGGHVRIDPDSAPEAVAALLRGKAEVVEGPDPCLLPKARKNAAELDGMRAAHLRDAVAMVKFLAWLDDAAPGGTLTEIAVVEQLEGFRREANELREISFDTISGAGPNGAIVHYRVTHDTNRTVRPGELLLVDSGGQYLDGTTDITRTVTVGPPPEGAAEAFTRVLQGMIAMSRIRWPEGRAGRDIEAVARYPLWLAGQDYDHGTGHGVGAYLSVHEGPARLSRLSEIALEPGMILSNEPGYYREGHWGIRIENLVVVEPAPALEGADARAMLAFETLTFVPIDRHLIVTEMLSQGERDWLDAYHAEVWQRVGSRVQGEVRDWLRQATAPLG
ncbi:aminopeptidase P family protein [Oceanicola sp. 502str15]|uniref:aminopeptidase P family protein n=1 Tax=Oceanicola sp. 502str15 TaxID=2696061 RepID=UPI002094DA40|nr:aminopeptidase P family protein [Oceanicola sp. 502str15]MCO6382556.1 M24 family metallopeptidase [Oceanicola sp. 502str15]